ncbi:hypothetical protein [Curtobacterium sp. NPDC086286]|uniref:hypothetical protein n=1 Tax=Curtobacterium sp. NPDC086286 TaxID=3363964 RepID=UPI00382CEFC9
MLKNLTCPNWGYGRRRVSVGGCLEHHDHARAQVGSSGAQEVLIHAAESMPLDSIGIPEPVDPPQCVNVRDLRFEAIGMLPFVKAFAVARSDVAVYVEIAWQGRLQRAWVPRDTVTTRKLTPRRD